MDADPPTFVCAACGAVAFDACLPAGWRVRFIRDRDGAYHRRVLCVSEHTWFGGFAPRDVPPGAPLRP